MITQAPRGTQDWYGKDMHKRTVIEKICRNAAKRYNIKEIITPVFEHTVLFQRGVGETTDVVQKEMYTFIDKGDRSITLKPEGTAGAIRAYLEHNMYAEPAPTKLFYVTPAFRYEKPQSGRLRQHHQFGVEIVGSKSPMVEVELITLISNICLLGGCWLLTLACKLLEARNLVYCCVLNSKTNGWRRVGPNKYFLNESNVNEGSVGSGSHFHFGLGLLMGSGLDWFALGILQNCELGFGLERSER